MKEKENQLLRNSRLVSETHTNMKITYQNALTLLGYAV